MIGRTRAEAWMWSEACDVLARAERLQRQLFELHHARNHAPAWEPPVDILETAQEVLVLVALPGVEPHRVEVTIERDALVISGVRTLPSELRHAVIHRLELPQGRFERRLAIPAGRYEGVGRAAAAGCVVIRLQKVR